MESKQIGTLGEPAAKARLGSRRNAAVQVLTALGGQALIDGVSDQTMPEAQRARGPLAFLLNQTDRAEAGELRRELTRRQLGDDLEDGVHRLPAQGSEQMCGVSGHSEQLEAPIERLGERARHVQERLRAALRVRANALGGCQRQL